MKNAGRCTGHCCHSFSVDLSPADLMAEAAKPDSDVTKRKDVNQLASILIFHGQFPTNPLLKTKGESWSRKALALGLKAEECVRPADLKMENDVGSRRDGVDMRGSYWYGCRHIQLNGDCGIYETRPGMCRTYPNGHDCQFEDCTMSVKEQEKHKKGFWAERDKLLSPSRLVRKMKGKVVELKNLEVEDPSRPHVRKKRK